MNALPSNSSHYPPNCIPKCLFLATLAGIMAVLAGGCAMPTPGPTDPKEFMAQRREWTSSSDSSATQPAAPSDPMPSPFAPPTSPPSGAGLPPTPIN